MAAGPAFVRARYAQNFIAALEDLGTSPRDAMGRAGLSEHALQAPDTLIPAHQLWELARSSALRSGRLDLGYLAGNVESTGAHGAFGSNVTRQPTLYDSLQAFCAGARAEYSAADFYLEDRDGRLLFCRGPISGDDVAARQVELYVVAMMLDLVRSALGRTWHPPTLCLQTFDAGDLERHFDHPGTRVRVEARRTAIGISDASLARSLAGVDVNPTPSAEKTDPPDLLLAISDVIRREAGAGVPSVPDLARRMGISPRTLQDLLCRRGSSYSQLIDDLRLTTAIQLLRDPDIKLAEIALEVGYASQSQFTRAFKRWTGLSPGAYRRQL